MLKHQGVRTMGCQNIGVSEQWDARTNNEMSEHWGVGITWGPNSSIETNQE